MGLPLFLRGKQTIGIDIGSSSIKAMSMKPGTYRVTAYGAITGDPKSLNDSLRIKPDYLSETLVNLLQKNLIGGTKAQYAVVAIPTELTYSRFISLPKDASKNLREAVELEAEQYVPIPLNEVHLSWIVTEVTPQENHIVFTACPKRIIDNVAQACTAARLLPIAIIPSINASAKLIGAAERGELPSLIIDIGASSTDIAILDGAIKATASTPIGGNTFTYDLSKKLKVSAEEAHQLKVLNGLALSDRQADITAALTPSLKKIDHEVSVMLRYYQERIAQKDRKIEQILVVGGGSNIPGLGDYFTNALLMPARIASPWQMIDFDKLKQPTKQFKPRYLTVAGLASFSTKEILT